MDGVVEANTFLGEWARLRAADRPASRSDVAALEAAASTPCEHVLVATVAIEAGRRAGDEGLLGAGLNRFRAGLHDEQLQVLAAMSDVAVLGSPERRAVLLADVWAGELDPDDPVLRLLRGRSAPQAQAVLDAGLLPGLVSLPSGLRQELKREIAWLALEAYIAQRNPVWLQLIKSPTIALGQQEAGFWEYELIRTLTVVAQGFVDDAIGRLTRLTRTHVRAGWRLAALRRDASAYSYLAAPRVSDWVAAIPGTTFTVTEASSPAEELGAFMATAMTGVWSDPSVASVTRHLASRPSAAFLYFIQFAGESFAEQLCQQLVEVLNDPERLEGLPWHGRQEAFARACREVRPDLGLPLLAAASGVIRTATLAEALLTTLENATARTLDSVPGEQLSGLLQRLGDRLSCGTQAMVDRGLVYRAVIDGSPLVLVGVSHRNRPGSFTYYEQAIADLNAAGFREVITYFDASLRHGFPDADWARVQQLEAERKAMIVRGAADHFVIKEFLKNPSRSWIVTSDDYRDHLAIYPELRPYWFKHRLHFHVDQDDHVAWGRPLDSPELPPGAPREPRRDQIWP